MSGPERAATASPVVPIDRQARDLARGLTPESRHGRWLVEASAGTGKTSVLVERALAYVRSGERRLSELAIITFTEAAAAELRMRLRQGIGDAVREIDAALARGDAGAAGRAGERERLLAAVADLETASIGTIHGFCVELLRLRPVEAGLDPSFSVADELSRELLFSEVWDDWLRRHDIPEQAFEAALDLGFDSEASLRQAARRLAELSPESLPKAWVRESDLLPSWERLLQLAGSGLRACGPNTALKNRYLELNAQLDQLRELPAREWQRKLIATDLTMKTNAGKKEFEQRAIQIRGEINEVVQQLRDRLVHLRLCEFTAWLAEAGAAYRERAAHAGRLDFDEQLHRARQLLATSPAARAEFRRRYPVVMVDEFQDTDRTQTEIVLLLAGGGDGEDAVGGAADGAPDTALFLVGDPKQSIYRFRGADLESYNRLVLAEIPPERRLLLRQSFRPLPALAAYVNAVMGRVMAPRAFGAGLAPYEAEYHELVAVDTAAPRGSGVVMLELEVPPGTKSLDAVRAAEADALARFVHAAVAEGAARVRGGGAIRPAQYGDVALLLQKMTELAAYEDAFHRYGVPFRVIGGRHYYRRDEVHALLEILRALGDPGDSAAVVAALRGPACGVADGELLAYALAQARPRLDAVAVAGSARLAASPDPDAAERCAEALRALRELRREVLPLPLADLVAEVIERTGLLPYFALQHRGEQRVANLHKAVDIARRIEAAGRRDLPSFMRWMENLLDAEPEESDSPYLEGDTLAGAAGNAVRVTTVHRAKGLEYPIVLLGGLIGGRAPDYGLQVLRREDGGVELKIPGKRGTSAWRSAQELEDARQQAEEKRLLYVALTRARDLLVLPYLRRERVPRGYSALFRQLYDVGQAGPGQDGVRDLPVAELPTPPTATGPHRVDLEAVLEAAAEPAVAASSDRRPALPRPTLSAALVRPSFGDGPELGPDLPPSAAAARERARRLSSATHETIAAALRGEAPPTHATLPEGERRRVADLAQRFLGSALAARARAAGPLWVEAPLAVRFDDDAAAPLLDGQLDLAFQEDGAWVVVDYKYSRPSERAAEEAQETQMRWYCTALTAASGRPVREAWLFYLADGEERAVDLALSPAG